MTGEEFVLIARDEGEIIGAVRLMKRGDTLTLRGMFIDEKYQRQGLGTKMLGVLKREIGEEECYCLSRTHLEDFYGFIGFKKIPFDSVPKNLKKRYDEVRKEYDVIAMKKDRGEV